MDLILKRISKGTDKDKIDEVASYFKQLQSDLQEKFIINPTND